MMNNGYVITSVPIKTEPLAAVEPIPDAIMGDPTQEII